MEEVLTSTKPVLRNALPADLEAVREITAAWPKHFVSAAYPLISRDFSEHNAVVAALGGKLVGYLIWRSAENETELLWLAVAPAVERKGIGTQLVSYVLEATHQGKCVFALTATEDSTIPGTDFDGSLYRATTQFFESLGFTKEAILYEHWSKTNHALKLSLSSAGGIQETNNVKS